MTAPTSWDPRAATKWNVTADGSFTTGIVGESYCQAALREIARIEREDDGWFDVALMADIGNEHDANAVEVLWPERWSRIGFLSRSDASFYSTVFMRARRVDRVAYVRAKLIGGTSAKPSLGVVLDLRPHDLLGIEIDAAIASAQTAMPPAATASSPPSPGSPHPFDDSIAQAVKVDDPQSRPPAGNTTKWVLMIFFALVFAGWYASRGNTPVSRQAVAPATRELKPDEPCTIDAPASWRQAAQNWCADGIFTKVNVSPNASTLVVLLQFSKKGLRGWEGNSLGVLNRFRAITDQLVTKADMNVAFSLHDTAGVLVGGCARKRSARVSTCNAR